MGMGNRLNDYLSEALKRPFDWHTAHCCHFTNGWLKFERGIQVQINSLKSEMRSLHGKHVVNVISERLGCSPISPRHSWTGDIVLMSLPRPNRWATGICVGQNAVVFRMTDIEGGLFYAPREVCSSAWPLNMVVAR
jgi:hypothetical protein